MSDTIIDLIRHGEPVGGRAYRGHTIDDALSDKGWQQMRNAIADYSAWQQVISSPMIRCSEFAKEVSSNNKIDLHIEDNLKEIGFGSWEGKTPDELQKTNLEEYNAFYQDPVNNRPVGAENLSDFCQRVATTLDKTIEKFQGQHALIVAHAGVIRAAITHILHAPPAAMYQLKIANAGITRFRINKNNATIEFINGSLD